MVDDPKQGGEELHHTPEKAKGPFAEREEAVLAFWNEQGIFEKTLHKPSPKGEYVFYDGPPFATGLPHYGHLLQSALKDAVPRYRTMQGYHVPRVWGWDCHGLPLENLIENEMGFKTKRDIEAFGIGNFNEAARSAVMRYAEEWRRIIGRFGRWADMENDYKTMDATYTESVWWAFKRLYDKGLIYEGFKSMHLCPRCGTTLSNFEVAQGYKDIDDLSVTVKLPLVDEPTTALLVWTTTPWTLPGNAAAAVNPNALYVKVTTPQGDVILAKDRVTAVCGEGAEVIEEIEGKKLVGKRYLPPFNYFADEVHKHKTHAWKVYAGDFVTMDSGTGIVHIAPAFGADDLALAQKEKIPVLHHVTDEGKFVSTVTDFAGLFVKPKGNPRETDEKIVAFLEEKGSVFSKEKIKHSYPHCWRCDTPLLNWASHSWFVKVSALKAKLLKENAAVTWVPEHVGTGRFHNGLSSAPDWAISRSRYWGAPIPVWRNQKTKEVRVAGSVDDVLSMVRRSGNRYIVMRHGEAQANLKNIFDSHNDPENHLTQKGRIDAEASALHLKKEKIDLIIVSPFLRTQETAKILQKEFDLPDAAVMTDERLREIDAGVYDGKSIEQWKAFFTSRSARFTEKPEGGESYADVRKRVGEFLFEIERRYSGKNILIVTHECPAWLLDAVAKRKDTARIVADDAEGLPFLEPASFVEVPFVQFPHNAEYELDLHRPYIDEVPMGNTLTGEWKRIPDVFDCWFESGSMPYASNHYPFTKESFDPQRLFGFGAKGYPAHFIAESIDQTRGWFYSLIVLGVALFAKSPYKAVVTNGLILASDGRKMSKKLKNYPDPMEVVEKYGADALRYYLLSSSVIRGEDLRFNEKGVDEVSKKLIMRLDNVRSFYDLYAHGTPASSTSTHVLDRWIVSRLMETVEETTRGFESYELDVATRPLMGFVDDLSTWYLRRSRDRFKQEGEDTEAALATLRYVFGVVARLMAPVMPFYADDLYRRIREESEPVSVHLCEWPLAGGVDAALLSDMQKVREVASQGLEARERVGIKIRQPLARLTTRSLPKDEALCAIIADEVNVKEVVEQPEQHEAVVLDTELTPELKEEGQLREWVRTIQGWRKEQNFTVQDRPSVRITSSDAAFIEKQKASLMQQTGLSSLAVEEGEETAIQQL